MASKLRILVPIKRVIDYAVRRELPLHGGRPEIEAEHSCSRQITNEPDNLEAALD
jgi:hypothetical protein